MKAIPGTLQSGGAPFFTTHWSVIAACDDLSPEAAQAALSLLCHSYWPPLYAFVRHRGYSRPDAQDLVQGFFLFLLRSKAYAQTDRNKGKFRSFLLASIKHYLSDASDRERALKRGGQFEFVLLDEELDAAEQFFASHSLAPSLDEDERYERRWAETLLARALERLRVEFADGAKARLFAALKPFLTGGLGLPNQSATAAELGIPVETLRSHLSRLRTRYRVLLREEVASTIALADDVEEELHHLFGLLLAQA
jgi:RNA polymerase sigma factor (sigma-70 family)